MMHTLHNETNREGNTVALFSAVLGVSQFTLNKVSMHNTDFKLNALDFINGGEGIVLLFQNQRQELQICSVLLYK